MIYDYFILNSRTVQDDSLQNEYSCSFSKQELFRQKENLANAVFTRFFVAFDKKVSSKLIISSVTFIIAWRTGEHDVQPLSRTSFFPSFSDLW